jgi:hypothetical protein
MRVVMLGRTERTVAVDRAGEPAGGPFTLRLADAEGRWIENLKSNEQRKT